MTPRFVTGVLTCVLLAALQVGLLVAEEIELPPQKAQAKSGPGDRLADMKFVPKDRTTNFKQMGFDEAEVKRILDQISRLEQILHVGEPARDQIRYLFDNTDDTLPLENALCGRAEVPARYSALELLVSESQGERRVVDLTQIPQLLVQDWYAGARVASIVRAVELLEKPQPDSSRMGLGAVFANQADAVLKGEAPWGTDLFNNWDWGAVKKKYPSVDSRVESYLALMHLVLENANGEGGLCLTN